MADARLFKVGELAERTGVSVRTLHHYEAIGLLVPSHRTASNHRMYKPADVARLQRIKSLRQLGFALKPIAAILADSAVSPLSIVEDHLARVRDQVALQSRLLGQLQGLADALRRGAGVDTNTFLRTIEVMTMWDKTFTVEQKKRVATRGAKLGTERVREIESGWTSLLAALRAARAKATAPSSPEVRTLVMRMRELTREFSGGDAAVEGILAEAYRSGAGALHGVDAALMDYLARAART